MVGSQLRSHMCVKLNMKHAPFRERRARPTNRLGSDANAMGVLYTPYMCVAISRRFAPWRGRNPWIQN